MNKLEEIKSRYSQGFIRPDQLDRYVDLGVITKEEKEQIQEVKEMLEE